MVYELASVFFAQKADGEAALHTSTTDYASLNQTLLEAQFRTYLCALGKYTQN